jgi:soluble calcium-activated nucleotidase 1
MLLDQDRSPLSALKSLGTRRSPRFMLGSCGLFFLLLSATLYFFSVDPTEEAVPKAMLDNWQKGTFPFIVVTDKDKASRIPNENVWHASLLTGTITVSDGNFALKWNDAEHVVKSAMNEGGRGMELSDLVRWNGELYTCDDRTGIVMKVVSDGKQSYKVVPFVILNDGDGEQNKGFKCEWMTVKGKNLYIGGFGKEFTDEKGNLINHWPEFIKIIEPSGKIQSTNWSKQFRQLRASTGHLAPGYLLHEAVCWSSKSKQWVFLPRRASKTQYHPAEDELKGTNLLITANEDFSAVSYKTVTPLDPERGFSSFKFLPLSGDTVILALKSKELGSVTESYITAFRSDDGKVLLPETLLPIAAKFEGLEFI